HPPLHSFPTRRSSDLATITLADAWTSTTLAGIFAYARGDTGVTAASADRFVQAVRGRVSQTSATRGFMWLADPVAWERGTLRNEDRKSTRLNSSHRTI